MIDFLPILTYLTHNKYSQNFQLLSSKQKEAVICLIISNGAHKSELNQVEINTFCTFEKMLPTKTTSPCEVYYTHSYSNTPWFHYSDSSAS